MKKILVTYVSYGSGHKTIAEYIATALKRPGYDVRLVDLADFLGRRTAKTVDMLDYIANHRMEKLFSFLYKISDNKLLNRGYRKVYTKNCLYNKMTKKLFLDFKPDIVLSTHWYGSNIAALMKEKKLINPQIITVVTDYRVHKMWMTSFDKDEHFIVANDIVKSSFEKMGCYSKNIHAFGLPVDFKKITNIISKEEIYTKYELNPTKKKILFFGGGSNGSMCYLKYLKKLLSLQPNYEILFVCGKNKKLFNKVKDLEKKNKSLKTFGFVTNVFELMEVSEIVISKAGGATVTECLEMQKLLIIIPGVGGQETYNAKFMVKNNYGIRCKGPLRFKWFMNKYLDNPNKYLKRFNNRKINNESLKKIAGLVKSL